MGWLLIDFKPNDLRSSEEFFTADLCSACVVPTGTMGWCVELAEHNRKSLGFWLYLKMPLIFCSHHWHSVTMDYSDWHGGNSFESEVGWHVFATGLKLDLTKGGKGWRTMRCRKSFTGGKFSVHSCTQKVKLLLPQVMLNFSISCFCCPCTSEMSMSDKSLG